MHTRRQFLVDGLKVTAIAPLVARSSLARAAFPAASDQRVLVVLQLSGGNDALNMLVPRGQDAYLKSRPTLALASGSLHRLDDGWGLHPEMGGLAELFAEGRLGIVHAVGYPRPDRSHFRSMEIWHTADPEGASRGQGWLGRLAEEIDARAPGAMAAVHVGAGDLPLALQARSALASSLDEEGGFELERPHPGFPRWRARLLEQSGGDELDRFLRRSGDATYDVAERMARLAAATGAASYPDLPLARRLRLVARMLAGGFDTRIFHVELGGFDTHARQAAAHAALLAELAQSLAAFQRDLEESGVAGRVLTLVFSEFGRRVAENGSRGTDHGAAAPVLVLGAGVRAGFHGAAPDLERLEEGDVAFSTDFRSVYATLESSWMALPPGTGHAPLELVAS